MRPLRSLRRSRCPSLGGLDIHRKQITFDYLDTGTGEVKRGQIAPADRAHLRSWLARFAGAVTESWRGDLTGVAARGVSLAAGPAARLMAPSYRQSAGVRAPVEPGPASGQARGSVTAVLI